MYRRIHAGADSAGIATVLANLGTVKVKQGVVEEAKVYKEQSEQMKQRMKV